MDGDARGPGAHRLSVFCSGAWGLLPIAGLMSTVLFEVQPTDPITFLSVAVTLLAIASAACFIPARRAVIDRSHVRLENGLIAPSSPWWKSVGSRAGVFGSQARNEERNDALSS